MDDDTGWISATLADPLTGWIRYRIKNGTADVRFSATGTIPVGTVTISAAPISEIAPSSGGDSARGSAYLTGGYVGGCIVNPSGAVIVYQQTGASRASVQGQTTYQLG